MKKTKKPAIVLGILYMLLFVCCGDGKLSHAEAEKQLNEVLKNRCERHAIPKTYAVVIERDNLNVHELTQNEIEYLDKLEEEGLITRNKERKESSGYSRNNVWDEYTVELTEKGKGYESAEKGSSGWHTLNLYCAEVDEITGIKTKGAKEDTALVKFKIKTTEPTPFFKLLKNGRLEFNPGQELDVVFVKYDDGWKLDSKASRNK